MRWLPGIALAICTLSLLDVAAADPFVFQVEGGIVHKSDTYQDPTWDTVNLQFAYETPIIIAIPNSNGGNPADFRIRNVTQTSFELTLAEPPGEDGPHVDMDVAYVAVEVGQWSLPDGQMMAAGVVNTNSLIKKNGGAFINVALPPGFTNPVVFAQIQTLANELNNIPSEVSDPFMSTAVRNVSATSFELALEGAECTPGPIPLPEQIGWMAIDAGVQGQFIDTDGLFITYETIRTAPVITGWDQGSVTVGFSQPYGSNPLFVAKLQTRNESDGGWVRYQNLSPSSVNLRVDEDRLADNERNHVGERAGLFVFSQSFRVQDDDPDGDGVASSIDNCPLIPNPLQEDTDNDSRGDVCDNCPTAPNANQADSDGDGEGDACDCGDAIVYPFEACDDGDNVGGDGCSPTCTIEIGWSCSGQPSQCTPICGDGLVLGGEGCDDGDNSGGDGCSASCTVEAGWFCNGQPSQCSTLCGDGLVVGGETCDDANVSPGDGCSASCTVEPGWTCSGAPSNCDAICGDGLVVGSEPCDDGGTTGGDGCSASCTVEPGWFCSGQPSQCDTFCGDAIVAGSEQCDDANTAPGDGCGPTCAVELGWSCSGQPSVCTPDCGDGLTAGSEECDDGNNLDGDGCSAICEIEDPGTGGEGGTAGGGGTAGAGGSGGSGGAGGNSGGSGGSSSGNGGAAADEEDPLLLFGRGCGCALASREGDDAFWLALLAAAALARRRRTAPRRHRSA